MKRKSLLRIVLLLLSIFILSEINIFAMAKTLESQIIIEQTTITTNDNLNSMIIVDKNGNGDYISIQEAINDAPEDSTIYVKIGIYSEIITIKKKISLIGEDKEETIINPISEENKYAIYIGASGVTIGKFTVKNGGDGLYTMGIKITASGTKIEDCIITDVPVGIGIWSSNNIISNCTFWNCRDEGIALLGSPFSECSNNKITDCEFYNNCDGIELQYSSNNVISYCSFYNNTHTGIDAIASSNDNNIISNCEIYNNAVHGIYLSSSSYNQIVDCVISDNEDGNIIMTGDSHENEIKNQEPEEEPYVENQELIFIDLISFLLPDFFESLYLFY